MDIKKANDIVKQIKNLNNPAGMVWLVPENGVLFEEIIMALKLFFDLTEKNEIQLIEQRDMIENMNSNLEKLSNENRMLLDKNIWYEREIKRLKELILTTTNNMKSSMKDIHSIEQKLVNDE